MIPERFLSGVWYDVQYGDFVTIDYDLMDEDVIINDEDGDELDRIDPVGFDEGDYYAVAERVVNDPAAYLEDALTNLKAGVFSHEDDRPTYREEIGVRYALQHATISEADQ